MTAVLPGRGSGGRIFGYVSSQCASAGLPKSIDTSRARLVPSGASTAPAPNTRPPGRRAVIASAKSTRVSGAQKARISALACGGKA